MSEFRKHVNGLLKKTKLNNSEKKDLENELIEHLNNIKDDYMKNGIPEKDSIIMAIKNFNNSEIIKEMNNFALSRKLTGINVPYLFKINIILILIYSILMITQFSLFTINQDLNLLYFLTICFIFFVNYNFASNYFKLKKDISLNMAITCFTFFLIEKIGIIVLSTIYSMLSDHLKLSILDLYVFDFKKILIYVVLSIIGIFFARYNTPNNQKTKFILSNKEIVFIASGLALNVIYFLYPNRFFFLNLIISKIFNINVQSFSKNMLYMSINNEITIINIGLIIIVLFIFYKFVLSFTKIILKQQLICGLLALGLISSSMAVLPAVKANAAEKTTTNTLTIKPSNTNQVIGIGEVKTAYNWTVKI